MWTAAWLKVEENLCKYLHFHNIQSVDDEGEKKKNYRWAVSVIHSRKPSLTWKKLFFLRNTNLTLVTM